MKAVPVVQIENESATTAAEPAHNRPDDAVQEALGYAVLAVRLLKTMRGNRDTHPSHRSRPKLIVLTASKGTVTTHMFFFVDESGNSGNNLFDPAQPVLSYGVLSSNLNVDALGGAAHRRILKVLGADSIHASRIGMRGLCAISEELTGLQERFDLKFDYYFIHKESYAAVMLFDAVFDAGINEAVKWEWYWTPLRFPVVVALSRIADETTLREAWELKLIPSQKIHEASARIVALATKLIGRLESTVMDDRLREIVRDGLMYAKNNPLAVDFGTNVPKLLSPNAVGFQFVIASIARRQKAAKRKVLGITVDRQSEFNPAQVATSLHQSKISEGLRADPRAKALWLSHPLHQGHRQDAASLLSHFPQNRMVVAKSIESVGLQLVDVYLWIANRMMKDDNIPRSLCPIANVIASVGIIDGISLSAMENRFRAFENTLPDATSIAPELKKRSVDSVEQHRQRVKAMRLC